MDEIDKLLSGIELKSPAKSKPAKIEPANPSVMASIDDLLSGLDESVKRNVRQQLSRHLHQPVDTKQPIPANSSMDSLLSQVKSEQDEKAQADLIKQQELDLERQRQEQLKRQRLEQLKAQRREEIRQEAQRWLNQLQPKSEEGRWFEEFACNYESRLEAAIDYLEALQEVNNMLPQR